MAKKSVVARNEKRKKIVAKYAKKRARLLAEGRRDLVAAMPRDSASTRVRNRCWITGRGRGVYRHFGLTRHMIRTMAMKGLIPGITKSSW